MAASALAIHTSESSSTMAQDRIRAVPRRAPIRARRRARNHAGGSGRWMKVLRLTPLFFMAQPTTTGGAPQEYGCLIVNTDEFPPSPAAAGAEFLRRHAGLLEIGRASCRERGKS